VAAPGEPHSWSSGLNKAVPWFSKVHLTVMHQVNALKCPKLNIKVVVKYENVHFEPSARYQHYPLVNVPVI
jgi:hypothetical protein